MGKVCRFTVIDGLSWVHLNRIFVDLMTIMIYYIKMILLIMEITLCVFLDYVGLTTF